MIEIPYGNVDLTIGCSFISNFFCLLFVGLYYVVGTVFNSITLSDCTPFSARDILSTTLSRLTHNVPAAWRSGGLHYRLCGRLPFNFVLPFLRSCCRRCAKPPVVRSAFHSRLLTYCFKYFCSNFVLPFFARNIMSVFHI